MERGIIATGSVVMVVQSWWVTSDMPLNSLDEHYMFQRLTFKPQHYIKSLGYGYWYFCSVSGGEEAKEHWAAWVGRQGRELVEEVMRGFPLDIIWRQINYSREGSNHLSQQWQWLDDWCGCGLNFQVTKGALLRQIGRDIFRLLHGVGASRATRSTRQSGDRT